MAVMEAEERGARSPTRGGTGCPLQDGQKTAPGRLICVTDPPILSWFILFFFLARGCFQLMKGSAKQLILLNCGVGEDSFFFFIVVGFVIH